MVRLLNASICQPPPPPRVEGWEWGWRSARPWLRVHDVRVWECWGTLFSRMNRKINCNENTNNDKCSLPVIVAESLIDIVVIIGKALQQLQPGTAPCISAFFTISGSKRYAPRRGRPRPVRPCQGLRGWLTWLYSAARCLDFLLQIAFWNFSVW